MQKVVIYALCIHQLMYKWPEFTKKLALISQLRGVERHLGD